MGAVTLWVRSVLRRQRGATVFLVALLGLPSGIVFAAFEANHRAAGSLDRVIERSESWDVSMEMCPADIEVTGEEDAPTLRRICYSPAIGERLLSFLKTVPEVERAAVADPFQHAFLDPRSPNGWGWHMNGTYAFRTPGRAPFAGRCHAPVGTLAE